MRIISLAALMTFAFASCSDNKDAVAPLAAAYDMKLAITPRSISADGASQARVTATLPAAAPSFRRNVTFTSTSGSFVQGSTAASTVTVTADADGTAFALLRAPRDLGVAIVQASNGGAVRTDTVTFTRAVPERIDVDVDKFNVKATFADYLTITVRLGRASGKVSAGTPIRLRVAPAAAASQGIFGSIPLSDSSGTVSTRFTPGPTTHRGPMTITAEFENAGGIIIAGEAIAVVIDPTP